MSIRRMAEKETEVQSLSKWCVWVTLLLLVTVGRSEVLLFLWMEVLFFFLVFGAAYCFGVVGSVGIIVVSAASITRSKIIAADDAA